MHARRILLFAVVAAVAYGILHDQVTVRICIEYFTIGHPRVFPTKSPTLLALGWGVIATCWVGLLLGVVLAIAARAGSRPRIEAFELVRPISILMGVAAVCALSAGLIGYGLATSGSIRLLEPLASRVPIERHNAFIADGFAHTASYAASAIGGVVLGVRIWGRRGRLPSTPPITAAAGEIQT